MTSRSVYELVPEFSAEIDKIKESGITAELLQKIIQKHRPNALYNYNLYQRYMGVLEGVPIFGRQPRYEEEKNAINNKVNNDFFSEIVDFKTGYFAGEPIAYGYSSNEESLEVTGGEKAVAKATKTLTDFITRNNMYGVDMEITKYASIYGYAGRLFYIDKDRNERVMPVHGYETIILTNSDISEPEYAIRYFQTADIDGIHHWTVEFYDSKYRTTFKGELMSLQQIGEPVEHLFDYCPLQGIANNKECIGDAEKVLGLIDDYDKVVSDNSNEIESFIHALMICLVDIPDETLRKAQKTGALVIPKVGSMSNNDPIKFVTKNINDTFAENHLKRLENNIYRFSKTPNLSDETFGSASGVSLKFKLHGLETKCGMYEAKIMDAVQYMFKVLASSWKKRGIAFEPLQVTLEFRRNFPLDKLSDAQTAQAYIGAGLPKEWVFGQVSGVDDVDYIMQLLDKEKSDIANMYEDMQPTESQEDVNINDNEKDDESRNNN